jgi:hypothetical protein
MLSASYVKVAVAAPARDPVASQQDCFDAYNDDTYNLDREDGRNKLALFKKSNCYEGKGGNCSYVVPTAEAVPRGAANKALIGCTDPSKTTDGGTTGSGDGITDPAAGGCSESELNNAEECGIVKRYINPLIKLLSILVGIVAVIAIIFGAIQVSTSAGDPQKSASGKNHIRNALIGLVAYVLLFVFLQWIIPGGI